jgi:hypothetical protein
VVTVTQIKSSTCLSCIYIRSWKARNSAPVSKVLWDHLHSDITTRKRLSSLICNTCILHLSHSTFKQSSCSIIHTIQRPFMQSRKPRVATRFHENQLCCAATLRKPHTPGSKILRDAGMLNLMIDTSQSQGLVSLVILFGIDLTWDQLGFYYFTFAPFAWTRHCASKYGILLIFPQDIDANDPREWVCVSLIRRGWHSHLTSLLRYSWWKRHNRSISKMMKY